MVNVCWKYTFHTEFYLNFQVFFSQNNFPKFTLKESINDRAYLPLTGLKVLTCEDEAMSLGV